VSTLPVIALGVGVGVDYGIYLYDRIEIHLEEGKDLEFRFAVEALPEIEPMDFRQLALERIKVGVDVGWMTSFASQIPRHVVNTVGLSFHIIGLYRYLDLPDLAALIAPRSVLVINGSRDRLFPIEGVQAAFAKIASQVKASLAH